MVYHIYYSIFQYISSKVSTRSIIPIEPIEGEAYLYVHQTMEEEKRWRGEEKGGNNTGDGEESNKAVD